MLPRRFVSYHIWEKLGLRASLAPSAPPSFFVSYFPVWLLYIWTTVSLVSWTMKVQSFEIDFLSHVDEGV